MPREFISEYGLDPEKYIQQFVDQILARCPEFSEQTVDEAIFVDDGPVDYLVWFALDEYNSHTFFYKDASPDKAYLQRLIFLSPTREEMATFKGFLQQQYGIYRELEVARLLELQDIYQPKLGNRPRVNLGICHEPGHDQIVSGISGTPRTNEQEIFENINKILPAKNIEKFITQSIRTINQNIEEEADRHTITANVRPRLDADGDFRHETTKPLPEGIHPKYTGDAAELWQKPASKVEYMAGSQGFLQLWIPVEADEITLVRATAGEYDREAIVDAIREEFETAPT